MAVCSKDVSLKIKDNWWKFRDRFPRNGNKNGNKKRNKIEYQVAHS